jgi:hypothetical protein
MQMIAEEMLKPLLLFSIYYLLFSNLSYSATALR